MNSPDRIPAHQLRRMRERAKADAQVAYYMRACWGPWREISAAAYMRWQFQMRQEGIEGVTLARVERSAQN